MVVLDADKERMKELEERFEEITPTYQKSQKKKKGKHDRIKDKDNMIERLRYNQLRHQKERIKRMREKKYLQR